MGQVPQQVFLAPLLIGTDGSQKMSKSLGNYIGVAEAPSEIYGKVMSIPDDLILDYFTLLTDVPDGELAEFREQLEGQTVNPMVLKKRLARELVTQLYDPEQAAEAEGHFTRVHQERELPEEIEEYRLALDSGISLREIIVTTGMAKSRSEAGRLIAQGAVSIDGEKTTNPMAQVTSGSIIKVGRRRFAKVINTDETGKGEG
jgi:tyrosyl-tRNA synthetase